MVHLVSVHDEFHARVIAARLGSDGVLTEVRPPLGGPYPLPGELQLFVDEDDAQLARALLQADEDESAASLEEEATFDAGEPERQPLLAAPLRMGLAGIAVLAVAALLLAALSRAG